MKRAKSLLSTDEAFPPGYYTHSRATFNASNAVLAAFAPEKRNVKKG